MASLLLMKLFSPLPPIPPVAPKRAYELKPLEIAKGERFAGVRIRINQEAQACREAAFASFIRARVPRGQWELLRDPTQLVTERREAIDVSEAAFRRCFNRLSRYYGTNTNRLPH